MAESQVHPTPTCCACVLRAGQLLLIERAQEPGTGNWSFPGGRIELGETCFDAVVREVREEVGIEIAPEQVFQVYDWITRGGSGEVRFHYVVNYVRARYVSGEAQARSDAARARWVRADELTRLQMHPFARQTAERLLGAGAEDRAEGPSQAAASPVPSCCACVVHDGRLLLVRRAQEPGRGEWSFPGGRVELGETVHDAIVREVREEVGIEIEPQEVFQVRDWITRDARGQVQFHYVSCYVRARYRSGRLRPASDAEDARWVTREDLARLYMHPWSREIAARVLGDDRG